MGSSSASDDDWLEAELERQLLETEEQDEEDDEDLATILARARSQREAEEQIQQEGEAAESLPDSFRELMAKLQEWGSNAAESVEEGLREALEEASGLERKLQESLAPEPPPALEALPPAPLPAEALELEVEEEPAAISSVASEPSAKELDAVLADLAAEARAAAQEELRASLDVGGEGQAALSAEAEEPKPTASDKAPAEDEHVEVMAQDLTTALLEPSPSIEPPLPPSGTLPEEAPQQDAMEELQRKIEEERVACLAELERQHQALVVKMQEEADARRQEEERLREEVRMHSEELWCREFYRTERTAERRERRALGREDRRSRQVREEEQRLLEDAERAKEASERQAMAREDALSAAVRRREHEEREAAALAIEDARSAAWCAAVRLAEELQRLAAADAESFRWREATKEAAESKRMEAEDHHSTMLRLCSVPRVSAHAVAGPSSAAPDLQQDAKTAASPLAAKLGLLPANGSRHTQISGQAAAAAAAATNLADPASVLASLALPPSTQAKGRASSGEAQPGVETPTILDAWGSQEATGGASLPSSAARGAAVTEVTARSCGSSLCTQLLQGSARWRGRPAPARKRTSGCAQGSRDVNSKTTPKRAVPSAAASAAEDLGLDGLAGGLEELIGFGAASELVRLEVRMEGLESLPELSQAPQLRVLILSGNKLKGDLEALQHCPHLEELSLCQNSLTSLDGLRHLQQLTVLKATMNEIGDAQDLSRLSALRVVDLSKNRLTSVSLHAPGLAKLVLYRNGLDSMTFLQHLPSLTELDLGRNKLTELDPRISEWNPLLVKIFLYENRLASLPEMRLPLLTDLWVDNNVLDTLGPLGFLPSLERLQAKHNQIRSLSSPIAASPLLQTLELAFNQLAVAEPPKVLVLPRLRRLQLNDNPAAAELMEEYRPWVLRMAPQLEELDNETVSEPERLSALKGQASSEPRLAQELAWASSKGHLSSEKLGSSATGGQVRPITAPSGGLLGLVSLVPEQVRRQSRRHAESSEMGRDELPTGATRSSSSSLSLENSELISARRAGLLGRWHAGWASKHFVAGGCQMCELASWCEALTAARSAALVAYAKDERRSASVLASFGGSGARARNEALFVLQRRQDFWADFLELCGAQHDSLTPWPHSQGAVCRKAAFEMPLPGMERSRQQLIRAVQSRWRGILARRLAQRLRLDHICEAMSCEQRKKFVCVQALWRAHAKREELRKAGVVLPGDRKRALMGQAATQLQAALRGSRVRRKLRWAKEMSKMVDIEDCPEVDVGDLNALLDEAQEVATATPFSFQLPTAPAPAAMKSARDVTSARQPTRSERPAALDAGTVQGPGAEVVPKMAWSTPPSTAMPGREGAHPEAWDHGHLAESSSVASSPHSSRPGTGVGPIPRRSRSMSSTAESAITEPDCQGNRLNRVDQAKEDWGFQDSATAKAYLAAQRRRQPKPPALPGHNASASRGLSSSSRGHAGTPTARKPAGSSSKSLDPIGRGSARGGGGGSCVKAQDAIAEFRRQQEEAERAATASPTLEFRSGSPNLKLMRSSKGLQGLGQASGSPRARSPLHR
eukprot:TRINITY_DN32402_c0_g1_i1.p1 TRINITY_DN32402_c0_g1~~TRINITY_DN32402_c0_g1_i1.p1  ORF type:complete len:1556 (-),score=382.55 TRINITY_DN32402_c0_g1_i1:157-4824(-)